MEQFHRFKNGISTAAQHCTVAYKTENWAFICRCLTDLCRSPCRSEKDALQQLHKTLGYISWALDQKTNLQPLRIHLHNFILQGQKLLPLQTELTHRLGCSACWSISEGVFKSWAAARLLLSVSWGGGHRGKGRKEGPQLHWELGITFQTAHRRTMKKVDVVLSSIALLDGDVIHPSIYGHRGPALVWTPKWGRRKGSNLLHCFAFPLGKEARLDSRWHDSHNVSTFKFRFLFPHLYWLQF